MAAKKIKKGKNKKPAESAPMPSLIFHEMSLQNTTPSETPIADQIEKELQTPGKPPTLDHLKNYDHSAHRLMWLGVILVTLVVCAMWSWSIYSQFTTIKWSQTKEKNLVEVTKESWNRSFTDTENETGTKEQINVLKNNLVKLFAGAAASSSVTTTPGASTTP